MAQIAAIAVSALAALNEGAQKRKLKNQEADSLRAAAMRRMAATSAEVSSEEKNKERMESRALAVAAASGAGVDDPTVVNVIGDLNAEGMYRMMARLWVGQDEAAGLREAEYAARREGEAHLNAGYVKAITTVLSSVQGMGGSQPTPTTSAKKATQTGYPGFS